MTTGPGDPAVRTDRPGRADDRAAARPRPAPQGPPVTRSENAARPARRKVDLTRFAWLSIAAAITTITLKAGAWALTGSVGLLSDAAESVVNLVAAVVALIALRVAIRPATERFLYGRAKAEYFSAAVEGVMIFAAAGVILVTAVERFLNPRPLENLGWGLAISVVASLINGAVALVLLRAGRTHGSITLRADGKHLMTDVITSAGVLIGVGLVALTGWERLDALVAFAVGVNIIVTGIGLITESVSGLLDKALPDEEHEVITEILRRRMDGTVTFHGLQTREAGQEKYMNVHVLVPDDWTVKRGHDYIDGLEHELMEAMPTLHVLTHLEPISDPASYEDIPEAHVPIHGEEKTGLRPPEACDDAGS
ncbi:cation diffusion facilitator family transporter [Brachybacterium sp. EE-P12]|uniref:cation diffusion facilitator family transporter n=1 Tax=Brachybacterium sp. EE-P12 TaxID=2306299 RepID=UPI003516FDBC